jgi:hypothetical protein
MFLSPGQFPGTLPNRPREPLLIDNPFAPELLATGFAGFANMGGLIQVTLESLRGDHAGMPKMDRVVVGRLVLPVPTAQALVTALNGFLEQQGLSPSKAAADGASFQ